MTENVYQLVWLTYLVTSGVFFVAWFVLTGKIQNLWVQMLLRFPLIAVVLTPVSVEVLHHDVIRYSPVIAAIAVDVVAGHMGQAIANGALLLVTVILSIVLGVVWMGVVKRRRA